MHLLIYSYFEFLWELSQSPRFWPLIYSLSPSVLIVKTFMMLWSIFKELLPDIMQPVSSATMSSIKEFLHERWLAPFGFFFFFSSISLFTHRWSTILAEMKMKDLLIIRSLINFSALENMLYVNIKGELASVKGMQFLGSQLSLLLPFGFHPGKH